MPTNTTLKRTLPQAPTNTLKSKIVGKVPLGDNREIRVMRIQTGLTEDFIRIGIYLRPGGESMSGAVFPASHVEELIALLEKAI